MEKFYNIYNDDEIKNRYKEIENYEDLTGGWAYHNFSHAHNVVLVVEKLLRCLDYKENFIEEAKIAAILHDVGANEGKENHAFRSYLFAEEYITRKNINLIHKEEVLEAIKIHSDGFDSNNIMALALVLADKLDVKSNRITKAGKEVLGNRQYSHIHDIDINIKNNLLTIKFITTNKFDSVEAKEYYFTKKIFNAINSFSRKINLTPVIYLNDQEWI